MSTTANPAAISALFTGVVSDILDGMGLFGQVGERAFHHVDRTQVIAGRAQTARAVPVSQAPDDPYSLLLRAIDQLGPAKVLVISAPQASTSSLFGGLLANAVSQAGGAGVIVDGHIRDIPEIRRVGVPTGARGAGPLDSYGRDEVVEISGPVFVSGVLVRQNDFVLSDEDGFVAVPAHSFEEVLAKCQEKITREDTMRSALVGGMSVADAFAKFGVL